jgi:hypothetical protein
VNGFLFLLSLPVVSLWLAFAIDRELTLAGTAVGIMGIYFAFLTLGVLL